MKASLITITLAAMLSVASLGYAQQEFEAAAEDKKSSDIDQKKTKNGKVVRPSQHSSVVVMMSEHGLEIFSPGASVELGLGEKLVTEPIEHEQRIGEGIYDKKSHGGIRLIGWFF